MEQKTLLTRGLTVIGTIFIWLPILSPVGFSLIKLISGHVFLFDYLMTAELFPVALVGGGLLLFAAFRVHLYQKMIGGALAAAIVSLAAGQALAVLTGLASGEVEPAGWPWALVVASLILYILALCAAGIIGILLVRDQFKPAV